MCKKTNTVLVMCQECSILASGELSFDGVMNDAWQQQREAIWPFYTHTAFSWVDLFFVSSYNFAMLFGSPQTTTIFVSLFSARGFFIQGWGVVRIFEWLVFYRS